LMRKWPSTNGPFFSERAITSLFLHAAQTAPLRPPHLFESPHRTRHAVRLRAERADKPRSLCVRNPLDDHSPTRLAQLVQHRFRRSHCHFYSRPRRLGCVLRCSCFGGRALHWPSSSPAGCAPRSCCSCRSHRFALTGPLCRRNLVSCACCSSLGLVLTSFVARSACRYACSVGSSCPASGRPTAFAGDFPSPCLHRRRAGDPPGSWPRREPWA
jgi:hypothetical protein